MARNGRPSSFFTPHLNSSCLASSLTRAGQVGSTPSPGSRWATPPPFPAFCWRRWLATCGAGRGCTSATSATARRSRIGPGRAPPKSSKVIPGFVIRNNVCNRYFEYPAVAALMTTVLKHGIQQGIQARSSPPHAAPLVPPPLTRVLQSFTVNPLVSPPANFTYRMGNVYVKYSVQLIVVVPPPIHGATPRSTIAGRLLKPRFLIA